ncbi:granulocyte colony-stimulating factor receptor isoform X2 [Corythoichthys intestinalis]|uniref:granulocyte colony-stimulating factor receptor isoform X2 n=1 Tax=Corythoichthys intestinalis TaxID=161448 RepID=UPI0025A5B6C7|nr:granulocyte colony-stimulating factor receptor isoform X2 [Corythoichthys intestinalis]
MAAAWVSVLFMLAAANAAENDNDRRPCASIHVTSSVVTMGSPVNATCIIDTNCFGMATISGSIEWQLGDQVLPGIVSPSNGSITASQLEILSFNYTRATLTCSIRGSPSLIVAGVQIQAGYPPSVPQNLSCQTNLSLPEILTCKWEVNQPDTGLPTNYTLHTRFWDLKWNHTYKIPPGARSFTIPRSGFVFFTDMEIYVKAVNELGETNSASLILEPVSSAKFDRPEIAELQAWGFGCLRVHWKFYKDQNWITEYVSLEVRLKTGENSMWNQRPTLNQVLPKRPVYQHGLLHGTQYVAQIRVRYQQSPWSEWSKSQSAVTQETAPSGSLNTWMRVIGDHTSKQLNMLLFWKPSKRFRANSRNVSFVVSWLKESSWKGKLCATAWNHCTFQIPRNARKVYLTARNPAGESNPTSVRIYHPKGSFEPYKPYGISVYPRFKDGIGPPLTVNAYSLQKAPSEVPKIRIKKNWLYHVELTWDEIPLDQQNGIIKSYKLYYWDETEKVHAVTGDLQERKVVLTGLSSSSVYSAILMVSTHGGSRNGSTVHFDIKEMDPVVSVVMAVGILTVLCVVIIFGVKICYSKNNKLKMHFWPDIPDPANSSIKSWTSKSTQDIRASLDFEEPSPIYLSHLSFLEIPKKPNKEEEVTAWLNNTEDTSDLGESICGSPLIHDFSSSNSDSVPYATVIFPSQHPHQYLRSESTQPLLESEEMPSPKCYQNVDASEGSECFFGSCGPEEEASVAAIQWEDFPFLSALAMNDSE